MHDAGSLAVTWEPARVSISSTATARRIPNPAKPRMTSRATSVRCHSDITHPPIFYGKHDVAFTGTLTSLKTALNAMVTVPLTWCPQEAVETMNVGVLIPWYWFCA